MFNCAIVPFSHELEDNPNEFITAMIPKATDQIYYLIQNGYDGIKFNVFYKEGVFQTFYLRVKTIHLLSSQSKTEIEEFLFINRGFISIQLDGFIKGYSR